MKNHRWLRHLPVVIGIVLALILAGAIYWLQSKFDKPAQTKKQVQQITMIQPPPPPPPPPPPEVKPPEPEPEPIPEPEQEPEPAPEPADEPPGEELGVDADGAAGSDGFGLVGKRGGQSLLGGAAGSAILWYGGQVKRELEKDLQALIAETVAGKSEFSVLIAVWIAADGRVSRAEMLSASGKADVDAALRQAIGRLKFTLPKAPPENMPQPIKIRVTSKT